MSYVVKQYENIAQLQAALDLYGKKGFEVVGYAITKDGCHCVIYDKTFKD